MRIHMRNFRNLVLDQIQRRKGEGAVKNEFWDSDIGSSGEFSVIGLPSA